MFVYIRSANSTSFNAISSTTTTSSSSLLPVHQYPDILTSRVPHASRISQSILFIGKQMLF